MKLLSTSVPVFTTDLESAIARYEALIGENVQFRFSIPDRRLAIAKIGSLLLIGGEEETLKPLRQIRATFNVDSLDEYEAHLQSSGATILQPPTPTPVGRNMIIKDTDGVVFEFVELLQRA